jgi:lysozyme family protein
MTLKPRFRYSQRHHYAALAPVNLATLKAANDHRWSVVKPIRDFSAVAKRLAAPTAKARYQTVEKTTGVPWFFIAVVHEREASQDWNTQLGQGDPLNRVSVHDPKGQGPFKTWEDGAVAALHDYPYVDRNKDWTAGPFLTLLEQYNGIGYFERGIPSPYVWSGTDQYHSGKYTSDGVFNSHVVDVQDGCAGILLSMMKIDPSVKFVDTLDAALDDLTNNPPTPIVKGA